jgi:hypothetical protein
MEEKRKNTMILYRNLRYQQLFDDMCSLLKPEEGEARPDAYACASQLIDLAVTYGFRGNLWHCFLAFCMANNENAYSTSCEIIGPVGGSLSELARHDFAQVRELFSLDIARLDETENGIWSEMKHYEMRWKTARRSTTASATGSLNYRFPWSMRRVIRNFRIS